MVPTRFAWPHGGRQVYLSGSFTGWTDHRLMTPVEGSSTVFQTIFNLVPGYHKYKFLVDGVWRLDEQQPYISDESGTVNNIILVKEPEVVPLMFRPETPSPKSSMDVDDGIFRNMGPLTGGMHRGAVLQISDGDIDISRHRLSIVLSRYTVYELFPQSGKVFALDAKDPVKEAFHIMYEHGLAVMPIWDDSKRQFSGMLTASDFILILTELHKNGSMLTNEELEMHTVSAWKEGKSHLTRELNGPMHPSSGRPLIQAGPLENLKDLALRILHSNISTVPIIHTPEDGSYPQLLYLACLSGILKYLCRHFRHSPATLPILQQPVGSLPIGTWIPEIGRESGRELTLLRPNTPLSSAFILLMEAQVSSVPIVDDNGSLLDVYSRSDIISLAKSNAYVHIRLDQTSIHQALQLRYEASGAIYSHRRCHTCLRSDSLHEVMERLSDPAARRLIVIEAGSKRVEGIISLRDIFNFFLC